MHSGTAQTSTTRSDWVWILLMAAMITIFGLTCMELLLSEHFKAWYHHPGTEPDGGLASLLRSAVTTYAFVVYFLYAVVGFVTGRRALQQNQVRWFLEGMGLIVLLLLVVIFTSGLGQSGSSDAINDVPIISTVLYLAAILLPIGLLVRTLRSDTKGLGH